VDLLDTLGRVWYLENRFGSLLNKKNGKRKTLPENHTFKGLDGEFHYLDWGGSGPLAYLAHATGYCAGLYSPLAEILLSHLRVVGMDDRGHGATRAPSDPRRLHDWNIFVEDLERFLEYLRQPAIAIGHSRGAVVAMLLAVRRPDLIKGLVLLDPIILPLSWMWWWFLAKKTGLARLIPIAARAAKRKKVWPDRETVLQAYKNKGSFRHWKDGFLEAYIDYGFEPVGNEGIQLSCDPAWESRCFTTCPHDVWRFIPKLTCPTLVLYGGESDTFLPAAAKRFKDILPGAVIRAFPETGHFIPMERPEDIRRDIIEFLSTRGLL
jgi:pimeloyl-ACP methyl ester carboxylesterase